ncbi:hypothetical protein HZB90_04590 [archaeon]|nr:hypothetical protein [archaeon]
MPEMPDFVVRKGSFAATVYVVNPELLARDDRAQRGLPYLFYLGAIRRELPAEEIPAHRRFPDVKPYVGKTADLEALLAGRRVSDGTDLPSTIQVNGEEVHTATLWHEDVPFPRTDVERFEAYAREYRAEKGKTVRRDLAELRSILAEYDASKASSLPVEEAKPRRSVIGRLIGALF